MFFTSQSILFALSALFAATEAQPHRHAHQHGTSKRASGVVTGRGIVYADGNTGMGALSPKLEWSTDWTAWQDNPDNNDLGTFVPQVWGLDYNNGNAQDQCGLQPFCLSPAVLPLTCAPQTVLSAFLKASSGFNKGSTILGFNEPDQ